ncbi:MAG: hypothetical protein AB7F32_09175 [Victivallaceae bacterium]
MAAWQRCVIGGMVACAISAGAVTYHLSPDGDDDRGDGSRAKPWRSPDKVNIALKPGDVALFSPGVYQGSIRPLRSGAEGQVTTYRSETSGAAKIIGLDAAAILLQGKKYISIDGFEIAAKRGVHWAKIDQCEYIRVANVTCRSAQNVWAPFLVTATKFSRFENLLLDTNFRDPTTVKPNFNDGDGFTLDNMMDNRDCHYNVYDRIRTTRAGHTPFMLWEDCSDNVIRNCIFDTRWGRNFEFFNAKRNLIENNVITNALFGSGNADSSAKLFIHDSIFRRNVIFRNSGNPLAASSYKYQQMAPFSIRRSRVYFNTWSGNSGSAWSFADLAGPDKIVRDNVFKNNIWSDNNPDGSPIAIELNDQIIPAENPFRANIIHGRAAGDKVIGYGYPRKYFTLEEAAKALPELFLGNFDVSPGFVDLATDNFRLRPGSPAIDRGEALTRTVEAGSGRTLAVTDARYFYDGFGIPGEAGDLIRIGAAEARVVKCDLEKNLLTLDRDLKWGKDEAVNLPFAGSAPDLGAYESGLADSGPVIPRDLQREDDLERAENTVINCNFELEHPERWNYLWAIVRLGNSTGTLDLESPAASGKGSLRIFARAEAAQKGAPMTCIISPFGWVIDRFPMVRFSYRIPPGVPVGVAVNLPVVDGQSSLIYLGGSSALATGKAPNAKVIELIDDGKWHQAELDVRSVRKIVPDARRIMRFRFATDNNGKPGDQYWIDDFKIEQK